VVLPVVDVEGVDGKGDGTMLPVEPKELPSENGGVDKDDDPSPDKSDESGMAGAAVSMALTVARPRT
jgi:hypothetical protein